MADLTRERIAELRRASVAREGNMSCFMPCTWEEMLALLSMAERAVSEETVRKLAHALPLTTKAGLQLGAAWGAFRISATNDLRPAAEALAKGTK